MSTLNVSNITDGTDTVETGYVLNGSAKAWVNINAPSSAVRDSLNVASIVDNGTGDFRANYTSNMGNANYSIAFGGKWDNSVRTFYNGGNTSYSDPATSYFELASYNESTSVFVDSEYLWGTIHGDLA